MKIEVIEKIFKKLSKAWPKQPKATEIHFHGKVNININADDSDLDFSTSKNR